MEIWKPQPSKLNTLANDNPNYWVLCVGRSQYSEAEILEALRDVEQANVEWQQFQVYAYEFLQDEDGEMNAITGFATDHHKRLMEMLQDAYGYNQASHSQNSHNNCFPVKKWRNDAKRTRRDIAKIREFIAQKIISQ